MAVAFLSLISEFSSTSKNGIFREGNTLIGNQKAIFDE